MNRLAHLFLGATLAVPAGAELPQPISQDRIGAFLDSLPNRRQMLIPLDADRRRLVDDLLASKPAAKPAFRANVIKPVLNFSLRHQAGYTFALPISQYQADLDRIVVCVRVTPVAPARPPSYRCTMFQVPPAPPKSNLNIQGDGAFLLGEGKYKVDWALIDTRRRWASKQWEIEVQPPAAARDLPGHLAPGDVRFNPQLRWNENVTRAAGPGSRLTILLHASSIRSRSTKLRQFDQMMLLSSLSSIMATRPFAHVRLIAFNLDQQRTLYDHEDFRFREFQQLMRVLDQLNLGTVSYDVLSRREGHRDLIDDLIRTEMSAEHRSDAILFLGPVSRHHGNWKRGACEEGAPPMLYFQYRPPWNRGAEFPDVIENLVRSCSGRTFRIYTPAELSAAIAKMIQTSVAVAAKETR